MPESSPTASPPGRNPVQLLAGDPAPWFKQRTTTTASYAFDTVAGRYLVLGFYGTTADAEGRAAMEAVLSQRSLFNDTRIAFFGVSIDPSDVAENRIAERVPGIRHFLDYDGKVSRLYGALPPEGPVDLPSYRRFWMVLNPMMRCQRAFALGDHAGLLAYLAALPPPDRFIGFEVPPPVLVLPQVFEPAFCKRLIDLYEAAGGRESGVMRQVDGKTVHVSDSSHKVRRDFMIEDSGLIQQIQLRFRRRVFPDIEKVHYFRTTRMERYIIGCYAADEGGHFHAHRDNTTAGTAHRRFAASVNLNDEFDGGEVSFPEYSSRGFKAPPGGAVVFSCTLLHAVSRVTSGKRYAFLPFLYNEEAAKIREANASALEGGGDYRAEQREGGAPA